MGMLEFKGVNMKLHIGCGKRDFGKDWIHIDGAQFDHIQYHDIINLPFEDGTVDIIYACHVIEYFDRNEVVKILKGWYAKLKEGGILRIAVPDFEAIAKLYVNNEYSLDSFLGPLYGKMYMNNDTIYHKTVYDEQGLVEILKIFKFVEINRYDWRETEHGYIDDQSQAYLPHMDKENGTLISLNVECIK